MLTASARASAMIAVAASAVLASPVAADPVACQRTINGGFSTLVRATVAALQTCHEAVVEGRGSGPCPDATAASLIAAAESRFREAVARACGGEDKRCGTGGDDEPLAAIGWDVGTCPDFDAEGCTSPIQDCDGVSECVLCVGRAAADRTISLSYDGLSPSEFGTGSDVNTCQAAIGKSAANFLRAKLRALRRCEDAVLRGRIAGPCPAGDGDTARRIATAESKMVARICRSCGGVDGQCDGTDDQMLSEIGFPAECPSVTVPGGASCGAAIATVADLHRCIGCVTEFGADCVDALGARAVKAYPVVCSPGCGNGSIESGEECDGNDDAACPGRCAPASIAEGCTCPTGSFTLTDTGVSDVDSGWTGIAHDAPTPAERLFTADTYGCSGSGPDTQCSFVDRQETFPFFGSPFAIAAGSTSVCVVNRYVGPAGGTLDLASGELRYDQTLLTQIHLGLTLDQPCPLCVGDPVDDDGLEGGICEGGPNEGRPCDVDGTHAIFGKTSHGCPPNPGGVIGTLLLDLTGSTTGTRTVATSAESPACRAAAGIGQKCFCDTCNDAAATPCRSHPDCVAVGATLCGGRRCLGGTSHGLPCVDAGQCPGGGCGVPGKATAPNECDDGICNAVGANEGACLGGPFEELCGPHDTFRNCVSNADCPFPGDTCSIGQFRPCFLDPVVRSGTPGPAGGVYAVDYCMAPTTAPTVNSVAGLPGLGTVLLSYTLAINVP